jgi:sec-independent protein translocase protein TatC
MPGERRYAVPFVLVSLVLFALGGLFGFATLPRALGFLLGFAGTERFTIVLSISRYLDFVLLVLLAFGVAFEFPVVLVSLALIRVITSAQLRRWRRYALVVIAAVAAVITPGTDVFTMVALMLPLLVFYELAILVSRLLKR